MQVNDLVKVTDDTHGHAGRAGIVQEATGDINQVKLDATPDKDETVAAFKDSELQFLGR